VVKVNFLQDPSSQLAEPMEKSSGGGKTVETPLDMLVPFDLDES